MSDKDIHDEVLVVFKDPATQKEHEITIINLIEGGCPCNENDDFEYVRVIKTPVDFSGLPKTQFSHLHSLCRTIGITPNHKNPTIQELELCHKWAEFRKNAYRENTEEALRKSNGI